MQISIPRSRWFFQGCHEIVATKFHDFSMIFPWPYHKIPWPLNRHLCQLDIDKLPRSSADSWEVRICLWNSMIFPWLFAPIYKFHDFSMTLSIFSQNSMTFPEIPENFKIPENPWLFHDRGNPVLLAYGTHLSRACFMLVVEIFQSTWRLFVRSTVTCLPPFCGQSRWNPLRSPEGKLIKLIKCDRFFYL